MDTCYFDKLCKCCFESSLHYCSLKSDGYGGHYLIRKQDCRECKEFLSKDLVDDRIKRILTDIDLTTDEILDMICDLQRNESQTNIIDRLTDNQKAVYNALVEKYDYDKRWNHVQVGWATFTRIKEKTNFPNATITACLGALREANLIEETSLLNPDNSYTKYYRVVKK